MNLSTLLLALYFLIVLAVCIRIVVYTQTPSKSLAYLLLVVTFPVLGIAFYLSVGLNYRKRKLYEKKIELDERSYPELRDQIQWHMRQVMSRLEHKLGGFFTLANFNRRGSLITDNNEAELLINGERKFPALFESLQQAKHHIHIEYYIYEDDRIGNLLADLLIQKAKEGIKVRVIYDDFGSRAIRKTIVKRLKNHGVEAFPFYKVNLIQLANRLNYRNHRKIVVIDGEVGFVGGINISDRYQNPNAGRFWRDTHLKIAGSAVLNLQYTFLTDWNFCSGQQLAFSSDLFPIQNLGKVSGKTPVQIINSGPDSDHPDIKYSMIQAILLSKKEILITTPYFVPDRSFLDALKIAALSGVQVKLLVPGASDSWIVKLTSESYYAQLLEVGIRIFTYSKGFVHAKTMVCDGKMGIIGTANLDNRSFDLNFEVNAIVYEETIAEQMAETFQSDLRESKELTYELWEKRPTVRKLVERLLYLFSSLM